MKLLTWNAWFGGHMFEERAAALVAELTRRRPDVIALQEVTPPLRAQLDLPGYEVVDDDGGIELGYGVMILTRRPVKKSWVMPMPSRMGRRLVVAKLDDGLTVATIHLESTAAGVADRARQLSIIQPWLVERFADVVLVGDMNFSPGDPAEESALDPSFVDVWPALRPGEPGYSVDTEVNLMRLQVDSRPVQKRIDRVFLRSARWQARSIALVGTAPIDIDDTFVSDHFGLEVELVEIG